MNLLSGQCHKDFNHELQIGELRNAVGIITSGIAARIAQTGLPMYSDAIKASMPNRRASVAVVLKVIAKELESASEELLKGDKQ